MGQSFPRPLPPAAYIPANVPVINFTGGAPYEGNNAPQTGEHGTINQSGPPFAPQTQQVKAATLGVDMAVDVTRQRGWIAPGQPYGAVPAAPTLTSITPTTAQVGSDSFELHCIGTGFTPYSSIKFAGHVERTDYVSPTELFTYVNMRPPHWQGPDTVEVAVVDHGVETAPLDFEFTAAP